MTKNFWTSGVARIRNLPLRALLLALLQFGVSFALISWILGRMDIAAIQSRFLQLNYGLLVAALLVLLLQASLAAGRWRAINQSLGPTPEMFWHFRVTMVSLFFGQVLPSNLGGDAYRLWAMAKAGQSRAQTILGVLCDRLIGILALLVLCSAVLPLLHRILGADQFAFWSYSGLVFVGIGAFVALAIVGWLAERRTLGKWLSVVLAPATAFIRLMAHPKSVRVIAIGIAVHLCAVLVLVLISRAFEIDLSLLQALIIVPPITLVVSLPISVAGWGVREGAMIGGFALFGLNASDAVVLSVAFGAVGLVAGLVGSLFWISLK